ncbi:MAG TPA: arylamine N-acetyltransferase [Planococcus sp. (in: firmicutes)]|nr:arylamine N-acetyltransferase [Planococcus sp. (in: firmicutes)]
MDPIKYLKRFDAYPVKENDLQEMARLQSLHMLHIPFENLDVIRKVPIYLNLETIYDKVVNQQRGGFCYELNGLFCWLLKELGFDAKMISATVVKPDGSFAKLDTHTAIIVELDAPYLVDVGFGDSTISPIPLGGERRRDNSGTYRIVEIETGLYELTQGNEGNEKALYRFSLDEKQLADFHEGCIFNQVSEKSTFTHDDIVTKATPDGRITLTGTTLTRTVDGQKEKQQLSETEKTEVLEDQFGIVLHTEKPLQG